MTWILKASTSTKFVYAIKPKQYSNSYCTCAMCCSSAVPAVQVAPRPARPAAIFCAAPNKFHESSYAWVHYARVMASDAGNIMKFKAKVPVNSHTRAR